jgi:glutathione S-transferase
MLSESGAIVQYLIEEYGEGRFQPKIGSPERPEYLFWTHYAEGSAASSINQLFYLSVYRDDAEHHRDLIAQNKISTEKKLDHFEAAICDKTYLVGDEFTGADIMMSFSLASAKMLKLLDSRYPETERYLAGLTCRPAFIRALS